MKIESIRLKNYKVFRDVHLTDIPSFLVVIGANGSGKSTLFDVFGFLRDCLISNVRHALDSRGRFREVLSRGATEDTILIEIQCRLPIFGVEHLVTYSLEIGERDGAAFVKHEYLGSTGNSEAAADFVDFENVEGIVTIVDRPSAELVSSPSASRWIRWRSRHSASSTGLRGPTRSGS